MSFSSKKLTEIEQLRAQLAEKEAKLQSQSERLQSQSARIAILEEVVRHLKLKRFAPSSEKTSVDQFLLFDESELCTDPDLTAFEITKITKVVKTIMILSLVAENRYLKTYHVSKSSYT